MLGGNLLIYMQTGCMSIRQVTINIKRIRGTIVIIDINNCYNMFAGRINNNKMSCCNFCHQKFEQKSKKNKIDKLLQYLI